MRHLGIITDDDDDDNNNGNNDNNNNSKHLLSASSTSATTLAHDLYLLNHLDNTVSGSNTFPILQMMS